MQWQGRQNAPAVVAVGASGELPAEYGDPLRERDQPRAAAGPGPPKPTGPMACALLLTSTTRARSRPLPLMRTETRTAVVDAACRRTLVSASTTVRWAVSATSRGTSAISSSVSAHA